LNVSLAMIEASSAPAGSLGDRETVRDAARDVLSRRQYSLEPSGAAIDFSEMVFRLIVRIIAAILRAFSALYELSPILAYFVAAALVVSLVLLLGHIVYTIVGAIRARRRRALGPGEDATRKPADPAELAGEAAAAEARGDHILGVRLLYRACMARLEQLEGKRFRPGATNREHLQRYRSTPFHDCLVPFVTIIDRKWYGCEPCLTSDFDACRHAWQRVCDLSNRSAHADPA
jgi:hypothetical protein